MRAFITGASGFVGSHLTHRLITDGWEVFGYDLRSPATGIPSFDFTKGEITDRSAIRRSLAAAKPDVIFHLAGVTKSSNPDVFYHTNLLGTIALFDGITDENICPRVMVASSSAVYGSGLVNHPISEKYRLRPVTHYAVSKVAQEMVAHHYFTVYGLPVICVRTFNLIGPGQSPEWACSALARQISLAEQRGGTDTLITRDLSACRDFVDIRDAVRAYVLITERGKSGTTYNVCSEQAISIQECLNKLLRMSSLPLKTARDQARLQKHDVPYQVGNAKRLRDCTGWKPEISLEQSLLDLLNDWRQRVMSGTE